ncbi:MAG: GNAT family N-acetyltransferase, partial [archaeon]
QGKGYGKALTEAMLDFVQKSGKTAIGFCGRPNSPFYQKRGFGIISNGMVRVSFPNQPTHKSDLVFIEGKDGLLKSIREHPKEKVVAASPPW